MRRLILEDPVSRTAIWSRNLAVFAVLVAIIGIVLAHRGLDPMPSLAIVGAALALAALSILAALFAMAVIWHKGYRGIGPTLAGLALSGALLVYPAYLAVQARSVPPAADLSTDLDDPPAFMTTEKARAARHGRPPGPMSAAAKASETRSYPDFDTLTVDDDVDAVFSKVRKIVRRHKWQVVDEIDPGDASPGSIDAVAKTFVMGFPADVVIRVKQAGDQTLVDVRSVARNGWQEPGSNAARVQALIDEIDAATSRS